jgi:hypothetical protein
MEYSKSVINPSVRTQYQYPHDIKKHSISLKNNPDEEQKNTDKTISTYHSLLFSVNGKTIFPEGLNPPQ